jgi:crotonobetainyl-CoA:carnitine CoA-transferase CaiB-like acyl-CoA transferase
VLGAFGVLLALYHRQKTGQGQQVRSALAYTATMLQSPFFNRYEGKTWDEPRGQDSLGSGPLNRMYEANDGWLFLAAPESERQAIAASAGIASDSATFEQDLETAIAGECVDAWIEKLGSDRVGVHAAVTVPELQADDWVTGHSLLLTRDHDGLGLVTTNGPSPRMERTPVTPGAPASRPGADAKSVLATAGLADRLGALQATGVVVTEGVTGT